MEDKDIKPLTARILFEAVEGWSLILFVASAFAYASDSRACACF